MAKVIGEIYVNVNASVAFLNCMAALDLANEIAEQQPWNDEAREIAELMASTLRCLETTIGPSPTP